MKKGRRPGEDIWSSDKNSKWGLWGDPSLSWASHLAKQSTVERKWCCILLYACEKIYFLALFHSVPSTFSLVSPSLIILSAYYSCCLSSQFKSTKSLKLKFLLLPPALLRYLRWINETQFGWYFSTFSSFNVLICCSHKLLCLWRFDPLKVFHPLNQCLTWPNLDSRTEPSVANK